MTVPPSRRLLAGSAIALAALVSFAVLTDAVEALDRLWAVGLLRAGVFTLGACWMVAAGFRGVRPRKSVLMIPIGFTVAWIGVQLALGWTVSRSATWEGLLRWGMNAVVFFIAMQVCSDSAVRSKLRDSLLYLGFGISAIAVPQYFTSNGKVFWIFATPYQDSVLGPFVSRDHYASFIALLLPLALYCAMTARKSTSAYTAMAGAMFASVIAGASRAGAILVTLEVGALLLPVILRAQDRGTAARTAAKVAAFVALFTVIVGGEVLLQRFKEPNLLQFRKEMLNPSIDMIRDQPWTGFGAKTWETVYPAYARMDMGLVMNHAHNDWAEWGVEGGVFFAGAILCIFLWSVWKAVRFPWGAGVVAVFLHCLVDFPMQKASISVLLFTVLGVMAAAAQDISPGARQSPNTEKAEMQ